MLVILASITAYAQNFGIEGDGNSTCNFSSLTTAIAAAQAQSPRVVNVKSGLTVGHYATINLTGNDVTIQAGTSTCNSSSTATATIDFGNSGGFNVDGLTLTLDRMTLKNGKQSTGGIMYIHDDSTVIVVDGTLDGGTTTAGGGAGRGGLVHIDAGSGARGTFACENCTLKNGVSTGGGAIAAEGNTLVSLRNTLIRDNIATSGGGIYIDAQSEAHEIYLDENTSFLDNVASPGDGDVLYSAEPLAIDQ